MGNGVERLIQPENYKVTTTLRSIDVDVGEERPRNGQFPHLPVILGLDQEVLIGNLVLRVEEACYLNKFATISLTDKSNSRQPLSLKDLKANGNIVKIGNLVEFALRKIKPDGRFVFHFSAHITIHFGSLRNLEPVENL